MLSKLNLTEFTARLSKNTLRGNPNINGTPFVVFSLLYRSHHKFFGRINKNTFEITTHTTFYAIPYKIAGEISKDTNSTTTVEYTIKKIWFGYLWIRIIPALMLVMFITVVIQNPELLFPVMVFGLFFMLIAVFHLNLIKRRLRKFETDFKNTFEIK